MEEKIENKFELMDYQGYSRQYHDKQTLMKYLFYRYGFTKEGSTKLEGAIRWTRHFTTRLGTFDIDRELCDFGSLVYVRDYTKNNVDGTITQQIVVYEVGNVYRTHNGYIVGEELNETIKHCIK